MTITIKWNQAAVRQLEKIIDYIRQDSDSNATKVETKILFKVASLTKNPEIYHSDKYKLNNDGSFRAFEMYKCRITYRFKNGTIRIIRVRHTKMNPQFY